MGTNHPDQTIRSNPAPGSPPTRIGRRRLSTQRLLAAVTVAGLATVSAATPAAADHEGSVYQADLTELNGSGATGTATITVADDGETIAVDLQASGFDLDGPHAMHLHGIVDGDEVLASTCPTLADDIDGDGVLTVLEGAPKYGAVQISLTTTGDTSPDSALAVDRFPAGSTVDYERSGIPIPEALKPHIGKLHFVVHGIDENGNGTLDADQTERSSLTDDVPREATAPALCGTLWANATGPIQTGAGGTASEVAPSAASPGLETVTIAAAAAAAVGVTAMTRRRRVRTASIRR
ncbi:MAG: hypothetical protein AAGK32_05820 [Actinomycetota bacterium]